MDSPLMSWAILLIRGCAERNRLYFCGFWPMLRLWFHLKNPPGQLAKMWSLPPRIGRSWCAPATRNRLTPSFASFLNRTKGRARVLIPGCGSGYEVRAFHEAGHEVTAIEFSAAAVAHAREVLGSLGDKVILDNFFEHDFGACHYVLIYERGFLCSLPPARWPDYAKQMVHLLQPGGRLAGLFLYGDEPEPPPFPLTEKTAAELLGWHFSLTHSERVSEQSVPVYQGLEHWQEWQKICR
jgi:SAM-dependent methyltransferase